jgi:hypothetical protein
VDLPHAVAGAAGNGSKQAPASPPAQALSESELRAIERQITQRVLETLQPTLSGFLGEPLRIMLQDRLEQALGNLAEQCRTDIEAIVREAVAKALERETAQLGPQRGAGRS